MSEKDSFPLMPDRERFGMDRHPNDLPKDPARPPVVVPPQKRDRNPGLDDPLDFGENSEVTPRHHMPILEPEIEEVSQDVEVLGATIRDMAKKRNDPRQARIVAVGIGRRPQVGVRDEVNRSFHFSLEDGGENGGDYQRFFEIGKRAQLSGADGVSSASQSTFDPQGRKRDAQMRAEWLQDGGLKQ